MRRSRDELGPAGRPLSRRELVRLRRPASIAASSAAPRFTPATPSGSLGMGSDLINAARQAMGSYFEVRVPAALPWAVALATRALDVVDTLEQQLTIYRDDSELARINATAHLGPVAVEPRLFALIERAVALGRETGGAYDVASGALSEAWGFVRGPRRVPTAAALDDARSRTGSHHLRLDRTARTIAFDRPGVVINLGSIGKGYAIDRAARVVRDELLPTPGLIHGGRSSVYALGSPPGDSAWGWPIAIANPADPDHSVGTIHLRDRGMGTSGAAFQRFDEGGRTYGHLIDPRTGEPPEAGPVSVTVLAPTAAEADALSTAFYLLGVDAAARHAQAHPEVGFLFLLPGDDPARPEVVPLNVARHDFIPARCLPLA